MGLMRRSLAFKGASVACCKASPPPTLVPHRLDLAPPVPSSSATPPDSSTPRSLSKSPSPHAASPFRDAVPDGPYAPYTDDPEAGPPPSTGDMLQEQRQLMDQQDLHLDNLSQSINRQRDLSLQINDELDVHTGLLQGLDEELGSTDSRMSRARQSLDRVARGAKQNSTYWTSCRRGNLSQAKP